MECSAAWERSTKCDWRFWLNFLCVSMFYITWILKSDLIKDNLLSSLCHFVLFHWIMQTKREGEGAQFNPPRKRMTFLWGWIQHLSLCSNVVLLYLKNMAIKWLWKSLNSISSFDGKRSLGLHTHFKVFFSLSLFRKHTCYFHLRCVSIIFTSFKILSISMYVV